MSTNNEHNNPGPSPAKRRRDDMEASPTKTISKNDSIYFANGNIVLLSLPKENIVTAFKIYKEFLIVHSPVFEGMLSVPLPPEIEEYDGVPLVRLHDDAADLVPFLRAIYDPTSMPSKRDFYWSVEKVESIFKLSKKYQCDKILKCMQEAMAAIWPRTLISWESFYPLHPAAAQPQETQEEYILRSRLPEPCSAIRLARDYDVPSILPAAFYRVLLLSSGFPSNSKYGDGSAQDSSFAAVSKPRISCLSKDDLIRFVLGGQEIQRFMIRFCKAVSDIVTNCQEGNLCHRRISQLAEVHKTRAATMSNNPLRNLADSRGGNQDELCPGCSVGYKNLVEKWRKDLWNSLPEIFGVQV